MSIDYSSLLRYLMAYHNYLTDIIMIDHNIDEISESEEMYLITVARLVEGGLEEPIPVSQIAQHLDIQAVSANQMVHKLSDKQWLLYIPYKGVELTEKGRQAANQVLRDRRLWEVFLVRCLELPPTEADALACRFEHLTPSEVTCRLAEFLGHPTYTPQGKPIPKVDRIDRQERTRPLTELPVGASAEVVKIEGDPATLAFLNVEEIRPGTSVRPLAISSAKSVLLQAGESRLNLAKDVAEKVFVTWQ
jgi:DtxR family Mn-dependent transcriptional regulator